MENSKYEGEFGKWKLKKKRLLNLNTKTIILIFLPIIPIYNLLPLKEALKNLPLGADFLFLLWHNIKYCGKIYL